MTVPAILSDLQRLLDEDPTSYELPVLASRLAARLQYVEETIDEAYLPFSLLTLEQYETCRARLDRARRHLKPYGIDLMPVRSVTGRDVVLYAHRQQATQPDKEAMP